MGLSGLGRSFSVHPFLKNLIFLPKTADFQPIGNRVKKLFVGGANKLQGVGGSKIPYYALESRPHLGVLPSCLMSLMDIF